MLLDPKCYRMRIYQIWKLTTFEPGAPPIALQIWAKNGFKCFKMHSNAYSPKRPKRCKKIVKNGKKCQKITNNCKISEITRYGEQITKMYSNVYFPKKRATKYQKNGKKCKRWLKIANNYKISEVTKYGDKIINM